MHAPLTGQENEYFELQYKTETNVDQVYEDIVGEAATNVGVQTASHKNTNQEANNRRQASPKVEDALRREIARSDECSSL